MKARFARLFARLSEALRRPTGRDEKQDTINYLNRALASVHAAESMARRSYIERVCELAEAAQMSGVGPWTIGPAAIEVSNRIITEALEAFGQPTRPLRLAESGNAITAQGVYGDIELALQNVEWRREVNMSWLEFSRWGIQQIILVSRLHYVKNPIIRRLIDVCAAYVFARGVEVSSNDDAANEVLREFFERNRHVVGQNALCDLERRKDYDGNLFFVLFADEQSSGKVTIRTIDATEMQEVITDPDDVDTPWFYRRRWSGRSLDPLTGQYKATGGEAFYPALGYSPTGAARVDMIDGKPVRWESPVLHRKTGGVAKWHFGCPRIYPALDWAKESRKYLEACASVQAALSQISMQISTKGGSQALAGIKQQFGTTVGPTSALWDQNPPATSGSIFASGPGTTIEAFRTAGAGPDPEKVRQYKLMACMVAGVPETFLGDVSTGNLATATSLDRPTETGFLEKQEAWREDLVTMARHVLSVSAGAPGGRLREAYRSASLPRILECRRVKSTDGRTMVYEAFGAPKDAIEVRADFPAIREGDIPALVQSTVHAMTLENKAGQIIGIDEKEGVKRLYSLIGIENGDEIAESQYPTASYEPERDLEVLPDPIERPKAMPGGQPQPKPGAVPDDRSEGQPVAEARRLGNAIARLKAAVSAIPEKCCTR